MAETHQDLGSFHPIDNVHLAWIKANNDQKIQHIIDNVKLVDSTAWQNLTGEEQTQFASLCWEDCKKLKIIDRVSASYYCYYSLCWGLYFFLDPRWGLNSKIIEDISIPGEIRIKKLYANIKPINDTCYGENFDRIKALVTQFIQLDFATLLPYDISDGTRVLYAVFKIYWPEWLDYLPVRYFENTYIKMRKICNDLGLYNEWDELLATALTLIVGHYFFSDPAYAWLSKAFLVKDKVIGRDKAIKVLSIAQAVVRKSWKIK